MNEKRQHGVIGRAARFSPLLSSFPFIKSAGARPSYLISFERVLGTLAGWLALVSTQEPFLPSPPSFLPSRTLAWIGSEGWSVPALLSAERLRRD